MFVREQHKIVLIDAWQFGGASLGVKLTMDRVKGLAPISCPYCHTAQFVDAITEDFRLVVNQALICANANCIEEFTVSKPYKIRAGPFLVNP